ncbi:NlpC/P60 family protein, partial [Lachnospiraceae bacterium CLA-AA-H183]
MRKEDEAGGPQDTGKAQEPEGSAEKAGSKKDKYQKAQAKAEHAGEKLGKAREKLDKTEAKRAAKKPPGLAKKAVRGARTEAWFYLHNKIHEVEHENVGVEGAHKSELVAEAGARKLTRYAKRRWQEHPARKVAKWERKDIKARANVDFQKMASEHPELTSNPLSRVQ